MVCPSYFISFKIYEESEAALAKSLCEVEELSTAVGMIFGLRNALGNQNSSAKVRGMGSGSR